MPLLLLCVVLQAQSVNDVVLRAMQDELMRNLSELKAPGFEKPCFIMYGMRDEHLVTISATMGALIESEESHPRVRTTTRVLVGDFGFNDESLEDDLTSGPTAMDLELPVSDDYNGIRRSYWSVTDNVYREAARHYRQHQESLKEMDKSIKDVVHREFARSAPVRIMETNPEYKLDRKVWEDRVRRLSALGEDQGSTVHNMVAMFAYQEGHSYLVSSEGSLIKTPFRTATLVVLIEGRNDHGSPVVEQIIHMARTPEQLPAEGEISREIVSLLSGLATTSPSLPEAYSGPVLYVGEAVAYAFVRSLFSGRENLIASDFIPTSKGASFEEEFADMSARIGRLVLHESVTIKAKPKLRTYKGIDLLGSFDVDPEGIVPANELVLIENGVLKNLMNNRTLTAATQQANGLGQGPGVMEITTTLNDSEATLKKKLIQQAKKEGLDYAIMVKGSPLMGMGPSDVYRVDVADGKETFIRNAVVREGGARSLRRILGTSGTYAAYNLIQMDGPQGSAAGPAMSVIAPTALLLEEAEVQTFRMPRQRELDYVPSPLSKK